MSVIQHAIKSAPEVFLFWAIAIGTIVGRVRVHGFAIGATACTLIAAVVLGQLGEFVIPSVLKSILFSFFVFSIGYKSGPEFFASLSFRTLSQVVLALTIGATGLAVILAFSFFLNFDSGTAAGVGAGSLTQTSMMGTASGALAQLGLSPEILQQQQANIAAGYAVTYILGYIIVLLYIPLGAPLLMGVNLKQEAAKLEASLSSGATPKTKNFLFRKFQARAYSVTAAAGRSVGELEQHIGNRVVVQRILRGGIDVEPHPQTRLLEGDEVLLGGPTGAIVAAHPIVGPEIAGEHVMRSVPGEVLELLVAGILLDKAPR